MAVRLGAHMSIAGGAANALYRGASVDCDTIQMFVGSPNRWSSKQPDEKAVRQFHEARETTGIHPIISHSAYLINLGSPDDALWKRSQGLLVEELQRCAMYGIRGHVLHPGAHKGSGVEAGLARIAQGLDAVFEATSDSDVAILLETTAGMGTHIGSRFEHLAWLAEHVADPERIGICLDTAHILAAGYDFCAQATYGLMWQAFDETIGLGRLRCIHMNDSKKELGSHVDRHAWIGQGYVGLEAFRLLVNDPRLTHVPMVLETPKSKDLHEDVENLALLRSLIEQPQ